MIDFNSKNSNANRNYISIRGGRLALNTGKDAEGKFGFKPIYGEVTGKLAGILVPGTQGTVKTFKKKDGSEVAVQNFVILMTGKDKDGKAERYSIEIPAYNATGRSLVRLLASLKPEDLDKELSIAAWPNEAEVTGRDGKKIKKTFVNFGCKLDGKKVEWDPEFPVKGDAETVKAATDQVLESIVAWTKATHAKNAEKAAEAETTEEAKAYAEHAAENGNEGAEPIVDDDDLPY